jgi:hypothetical protein
MATTPKKKNDIGSTKRGVIFINGKRIYKDRNERWVTTELLTKEERKAFDKQIR